MKEIEFLVQGSAPEPYRVTFIKGQKNFNAYCTCPAGENGQNCKHRFAILAGDVNAVISKNKDQVASVRLWLSGTDLENALVELAEAEHGYSAAKERLTIAKRKTTQVMSPRRPQ
jgi:uncharacterized Zn finger protein